MSFPSGDPENKWKDAVKNCLYLAQYGLESMMDERQGALAKSPKALLTYSLRILNQLSSENLNQGPRLEFILGLLRGPYSNLLLNDNLNFMHERKVPIRDLRM